jgi:hypothetical protein
MRGRRLVLAGLSVILAAGGVSVAWAADGSGAGAALGAAPAAGGRAGATAYGQWLLSSLSWPAGTQAADLPPDEVPEALQDGWWTSPQLAETGRVLRARQPMAAVYAYVLSHMPDGLQVMGTGKETGPGGLEAENVDFTPRARPAGLQSAEIGVAVQPWSGGTALIGVYAHVVWFPARSTAERLSAADYQRVVVTASVDASGPREVVRTFRSAAVIRRLISYLDSLQAAPEVPMGCPAYSVSYQLTFAGAHGPDAVVTPDGCSTIAITVGGQQQPALWDQFNRLRTMTVALLGRAIPNASGPAVSGPAVSGPAVSGPAVSGPAVSGPVTSGAAAS